MLKNLPTKGASGGRWAKRPGARAASIAVAAALLGGLATAGSASAWDVCVNGGNPSPQVYGKGTKADPYVVCEGDSFQVTYTAQTCNDADDTGECMPTGVTYTWTPYPSSGNTDTVKYGPFTTSGLHTYTITATGTAAGFKMPNGSPCKNPPPDTKSGSDTVYVVASSSTAWTLVSRPSANFPAAPSVPNVTTAPGATIVGCGGLFARRDYEIQYRATAQPDLVAGSSHYSGCGGSVSHSETVTVQTPMSVTVAIGAQFLGVGPSVSFNVPMGNTVGTDTSKFTAGPQPGLEFRIKRETPAWYLSVETFVRYTPCFNPLTSNPGPFGQWVNTGANFAGSDFAQLPGTAWDVWSECCEG